MPLEPILIEIPVPPLESAFITIAGEANPFWLDSGLMMQGIGRYSILGCNPWMTFKSRNGVSIVNDGQTLSRTRENPFRTLRALLGGMRSCVQSGLPFTGGAVGYIGYEAGRFVEHVPVAKLDDIRLPDMMMMFYDHCLVIDRLAERAWIVAVENEISGRASAKKRAGELRERLEGLPGEARIAPPCAAVPELKCNFSKGDYLRSVEQCKEYIAAGDIFQANISRRFETTLNMPASNLFVQLRRINPAPMAAFMAFDDAAIISASPERFLRASGKRVETRPIKGTRPRGESPEEDKANAEELMASEKDNAELAMIVDLERNDLGRVCSYGSVKVAEPRRLESFPTVHHLVATVEGELHDGHDFVSLLRACFPGGSITGAPKIRAMEIIAELEPTQRSVYTGAVGYVGMNGTADFNIAIRTMIARENKLWFQAGGGIVADSDPELEYEETQHKAKALIEAVTKNH